MFCKGVGLLELLLVLACAAMMLIVGAQTIQGLRRQQALVQARQAKTAFALAAAAYYDAHRQVMVIDQTVTADTLVQAGLLNPSNLKNHLLQDWQAKYMATKPTQLIYSAKFMPQKQTSAEQLALNLAATLKTDERLEWQHTPQGVLAQSTGLWIAKAHLQHFIKQYEFHAAKT